MRRYEDLQFSAFPSPSEKRQRVHGGFWPVQPRFNPKSRHVLGGPPELVCGSLRVVTPNSRVRFGWYTPAITGAVHLNHQVTTSFRMCLSLITFPGSQAILRYLFQPAQAKSHRSRLKTRSRGLRIVVTRLSKSRRGDHDIIWWLSLPLWKIMDFVRWDEIPNFIGKTMENEKMFQTTNQSLWIKYWKIKFFYRYRWLIYGPFSTNDCVEWPESRGKVQLVVV